MINSRQIEDLTLDTQLKCREFMAACLDAGVDIIITSTYRDSESQRSLYEQGRTTIGRVVTNATAGHSFHNWRVAFDFVPVQNGKAIWNDDRLWAKCGSIAQSVGLEWGGAWKFSDKPHCQNPGGISIAQFIADSAEHVVA